MIYQRAPISTAGQSVTALVAQRNAAGAGTGFRKASIGAKIGRAAVAVRSTSAPPVTG